MRLTDDPLDLQIFHASDERTADLAVVAFQSLFATLYPDPSSLVRVGGDPSLVPVEEGDEDSIAVEEDELVAVLTELPLAVEGVGVKVIANSLEELREPDKSNAKPAVRILAALMLASSTIFPCFGLLLPLPHHRANHILELLLIRSTRSLHHIEDSSSPSLDVQGSRRSLSARSSSHVSFCSPCWVRSCISTS